MYWTVGSPGPCSCLQGKPGPFGGPHPHRKRAERGSLGHTCAVAALSPTLLGLSKGWTRPGTHGVHSPAPLWPSPHCTAHGWGRAGVPEPGGQPWAERAQAGGAGRGGRVLVAVARLSVVPVGRGRCHHPPGLGTPLPHTDAPTPAALPPSHRAARRRPSGWPVSPAQGGGRTGCLSACHPQALTL